MIKQCLLPLLWGFWFWFWSSCLLAADVWRMKGPRRRGNHFLLPIDLTGLINVATIPPPGKGHKQFIRGCEPAARYLPFFSIRLSFIEFCPFINIVAAMCSTAT